MSVNATLTVQQSIQRPIKSEIAGEAQDFRAYVAIWPGLFRDSERLMSQFIFSILHKWVAIQLYN